MDTSLSVTGRRCWCSLQLTGLCVCPQLAEECMSADEVSALYLSRAQDLEKEGKYKEAER